MKEQELECIKKEILKNKKYLENEYNDLIDILDIIKREFGCNDTESIIMLLVILNNKK